MPLARGRGCASVSDLPTACSRRFAMARRGESLGGPEGSSPSDPGRRKPPPRVESDRRWQQLERRDRAGSDVEVGVPLASILALRRAAPSGTALGGPHRSDAFCALAPEVEVPSGAADRGQEADMLPGCRSGSDGCPSRQRPPGTRLGASVARGSGRAIGRRDVVFCRKDRGLRTHGPRDAGPTGPVPAVRLPRGRAEHAVIDLSAPSGCAALRRKGPLTAPERSTSLDVSWRARAGVARRHASNSVASASHAARSARDGDRRRARRACPAGSAACVVRVFGLGCRERPAGIPNGQRGRRAERCPARALEEPLKGATPRTLRG